MGKTLKKCYQDSGKEEQLTVLRSKLNDRKQQIRRLKAYILELEKKLEQYGMGIDPTKKERPKKLTPQEKEAAKKLAEEQKKKDLVAALKSKYGRKET